MSAKPFIALTMGDPAGVGPELCLRMLADPEVLACSTPVIFGDGRLLQRVATATGLPFPKNVSLHNIHCDGMDSAQPGQLSPTCGAAATRCIEAAIHEAMSGQVKAIVTAPLNKESLHLAGVPYPGHTEMLTHLTGAKRTCMMLSSEKITTSLVTTHISLASVSGKLSITAILDTIHLTAETMRRLRRHEPHLVVCALNPHAGEHGLFGDEEARFIEPAVAQARQSGLSIEGPLPPDTAFLPERLAKTTAHICMYHDQGLIPFKMLAFETGVNITLGLPITRTSPDHGTAFDIAWTGKANPTSMRQAVLYAMKLAT
ncbi:MAG: 4-hydroxythreonine-4-phosphate dehydrogenase PdxA [bacterium]